MSGIFTYLVDIDNQHYFIKYVAGDSDYEYIQTPVIAKDSEDFSDYATSDNGSDTLLSNDIIVDETGEAYKYVELSWNGKNLQNPTSKLRRIQRLSVNPL